MSEPIRVRVNGRPYAFDGERPRTLLALLREEAGLQGTKEGCGNGECGACTVLLDGVAVRSCLVLAQEVDGAEVTTIEGLAERGALHPIQEAFVATGAVQCGYCAPGFIMATYGLLQRCPSPGPAEVRDAVSGHLCRCTGYEAIVEAVRLAVAGRAASAPVTGGGDHGV
jgi:aerobic-type carbon monoxide dehydrogenase small subunit (CoxS/CutS family)